MILCIIIVEFSSRKVHTIQVSHSIKTNNPPICAVVERDTGHQSY